MWNNAMWIGVPDDELRHKSILPNDLTGRFAYYRATFDCAAGDDLVIDITANSCYRLWVNGGAVQSGPCKGDLGRHYYDTVDLSRYLKSGRNVLAVQVLYNEAVTPQYSERGAIVSVLSPGGGHRLAVEGAVRRTGEIIADLTTGHGPWKLYLDGSFYLREEEFLLNFGAAQETIDFRKTPHDWKLDSFDDRAWVTPMEIEPVCQTDFQRMVGFVPKFPILARPIPPLYERPMDFGMEPLRLSAGERRTLLLDAGVETCGYPRFCLEGGRGAELWITYAERFTHPDHQIPLDDAEHGVCEGLTDIITLPGGPLVYEPFWIRTFRFVKLEVQCGEEAMTLFAPTWRETGYPMAVESRLSSSEPWVEQVWTMCVRTLQRCMGETYMDCPYYEQMQFSMDTRLQALFYAALSNDFALTEKALLDLHCSMTAEGLVQGKYPSAYPQIISTFSLHYIYFLAEHYRHTGKLPAVRPYLPDVDRILDYYAAHIGPAGLVEHLGYWEFVDWQKAWKETGGVPTAAKEGPSTIINLMYARALDCAAELYRAAGRVGMAEEYLSRKAAILEQVERLCWDEARRMYWEGPAFPQFTQHTQAWAVVTGLVRDGRARRILTEAIQGKDVLRCSFSTAYEWFRALEQCGMFAEMFRNLGRWRELPARGYTTCPEEPQDERSECHAWSALPIYELMRCVAGIRPGADGWDTIVVEPHLGDLPDLQGAACTPKGSVEFRYQREENGWRYQVLLPDGVSSTLITPDGVRHPLVGGQWCCVRI